MSEQAVDGGKKNFLTEAEMKRFLDAARRGKHGTRDYTMMLMAYRHSMRVSELIDVRLKDLDFDAGRIFMRRKKGSLSTHQPVEGDELRGTGLRTGSRLAAAESRSIRRLLQEVRATRRWDRGSSAYKYYATRVNATKKRIRRSLQALTRRAAGKGSKSMSRKFVVTGGFHLSQNFADRRKLLRVGPIVKALWRIPEEVANQLRSRNAPVPAPVEGYMIVNTGFEGIGIDSDIAQELGLSTSSKAKVHGVDGESYQDTCMALLLVPVSNVNGDKAAIGVNIEAVTLPKLRMSYDAHGLLSPEGQPVRIIGILGRQFLQFATFTYNGLDGSWEMQIDESIMRPYDPNAPEAGGGQVQRLPKGEVTTESSVPVFFSAERIVVAVQSRSKLYKVMQIHFSKKDGSLYVSFPYYKHRDGLVSLVTCPANIQYPTNLEMNPGGKATTHLVKYSHHPDGRTHFSQDGRVLTLVQKQSVPLTQTDGHIFTVKLQGITEFEEGERDESRPATMKRKTVVFNFGPISPEAIKIVGRWYSKADFMKRLIKPAGTPFLAFRTEQGTLSKGILLANPFAVRGQECVMALTCEAVPLLDEHRSTSITFVGGFDPPEVVNDEAKETSFLSFTYPVTDVEGLAREIGSIDFKRDAKG